MYIGDCGLEDGLNWKLTLDKATGCTPLEDPINRSVASSLIVRGKNLKSIDLSEFKDPRLYARWNPEPVATYVSPLPFNEYDKTAAIIRYPYPAIF